MVEMAEELVQVHGGGFDGSYEVVREEANGELVLRAKHPPPAERARRRLGLRRATQEEKRAEFGELPRDGEG